MANLADNHRHEGYDPGCPGCVPVLIGLDGKKLPDRDPAVIRMMQLWWQEPHEVREAFILLTAHNDYTKRELAQRFIEKLLGDG